MKTCEENIAPRAKNSGGSANTNLVALLSLSTTTERMERVESRALSLSLSQGRSFIIAFCPPLTSTPADLLMSNGAFSQLPLK